jgi:hypothetical protein
VQDEISAEVEDAVQRFNLQLAFKYVCCPFLDKRVIGLLEIKTQIHKCIRRDEQDSHIHAKNNSISYDEELDDEMVSFVLPNILFSICIFFKKQNKIIMCMMQGGSMTSIELCRWLLQNRILEVLYGEKMHSELLQVLLFNIYNANFVSCCKT